MYDSGKIAKRIKELAKTKGVSIGSMLEHCGLSKNTLSTMQSGGFFPRLDTIIKISDYLDVSIDYLLDSASEKEKNIQSRFTIHEENLIDAYRAQPELQTAVDRLLGVQPADQVLVYRAARSTDNHEATVELRSRESLEKIKNAKPVLSDEDL